MAWGLSGLSCATEWKPASHETHWYDHGEPWRLLSACRATLLTNSSRRQIGRKVDDAGMAGLGFQLGCPASAARPAILRDVGAFGASAHFVRRRRSINRHAQKSTCGANLQHASAMLGICERRLASGYTSPRAVEAFRFLYLLAVGNAMSAMPLIQDLLLNRRQQ